MLKDIERSREISKQDFFNNYVKKNKPVVFEKLYEGNPAISKWDFKYLHDEFGDLKVRAFALTNDKNKMGIEHGIKIEYVLLKEAMDAVLNRKRGKMWAVVASLADFPKLENEFGPPKYCYDGNYLKGQLIAGPENIVTELHTDLLENLYTVVKGCKRIYLVNPRAGVQRKSFFSRLPNFSEFNPETEAHNSDIEVYTVDLKAGETLYIPFRWWHYLKNMEPTIAVAFWWRRGWMNILGFIAELATKIYYK